MITQDQMMQKFTRKELRDFAIKNQSKADRLLDIERKRGRGLRVSYKRCEHGFVLIENNEPKEYCEKCSMSFSQSGEFHPYLNIATGNFYESKSEEKKDFKRRGLVCVGDDDFR